MPLLRIISKEMNVRKTSICVTTFLFFIIACHTTKTDVQESMDSQNYKTISLEKYGQNIEYLMNSSKTHVICLKRNKPTPQIPQSRISFFIYDIKKDEIIFEESFIDAEVRWKSEYQVEVKITPGIVSGDETAEDFIYVYDVTLRRKIK